MDQVDTIAGGCQCGTVRYELARAPDRVAVCHCRDCQRSSGAPLVAWAMIAEDAFRVTQGQAREINSSGDSFRYFCADCGSGLYFVNATHLPGIVDVQLMTLDTPDAFPPTAQVQTAEQAPWIEHLQHIRAFPRFPGMD